jgi:hypothetical protein
VAKRAVWALAVFLFWSRAAYALEEEVLTRDFGWPAGALQRQLDRDPTLVPFGKGAIFVPAMTNGLDEPTVAVLRNGQTIAEGTTGARIVVLPGTYDVILGSGTLEQRLKVQATVRELHTTVIPPSWAGLQVHVVSEQYQSLRGSYELIRVEDREYIGIGFGSDEQAGEPVSTWIVRPGLYKIVRVGSNYRARRDFATVRLVEGALTHFLLVINKDTNDFLGGGEVPETELFKPRDGFFGSFIIGGDLSGNSRSNVLGQPNGIGFAIRAFLDMRLSVEIANNPLVVLVQVEEGQAKTPDLPWQKSNDRGRVDALYVYRLASWIGPYVRFTGETNLVPGRQFFSSPTDVTLLNADGSLQRTDMAADKVQLSPSLGLSTLREGAGINVRLFKTLSAEMTVRTGLGGRQRITHNLFAPVSTSVTSTAPQHAAFQEVASNDQIGIEATVIATARLTSFIIANVQLDSLVPFEGFSDTVLDLIASIALKLTSYASVNYVLRYSRDPTIPQNHDIVQQDLLLRFSLEIP